MLLKFLCHVFSTNRNKGWLLVTIDMTRRQTVGIYNAFPKWNFTPWRWRDCSFFSFAKWTHFPLLPIGLQGRPIRASCLKFTNSNLLCIVLALNPLLPTLSLFFSFCRKQHILIGKHSPCNFCFDLLRVETSLRKSLDLEHFTFVEYEVSTCLRGHNLQVLRPQRSALPSWGAVTPDLPSVENLPHYEEAWPCCGCTGTEDRLWLSAVAWVLSTCVGTAHRKWLILDLCYWVPSGDDDASYCPSYWKGGNYLYLKHYTLPVQRTH